MPFMKNLTIKELFDSCSWELKLDWISGKDGGNRVISVSEINRPGLALASYFEFFRPERLQILGQGECSYLQTLDSARRVEILNRVFGSPELPGVVITHGREVLPEILDQSNRHTIPVLASSLSTASLTRELSAFLENRLAPMTAVHGVLTVVYGLGVLILGEAGIGKSECGLELVKRGHILVADDLVEIRRRPGDILNGTAGQGIQHYMEVRGLGIIDVKQIFGMSSVKDSTPVELVVQLERERSSQDLDRSGLEEKNIDFLGVRIPQVNLPLRPGRNVAVLLEVAALNERLKREGIFSAEELNEKLIRKMQEKAGQVGGN
jgi:HPr kinase/phosphorylase